MGETGREGGGVELGESMRDAVARFLVYIWDPEDVRNFLLDELDRHFENGILPRVSSQG